MLIDDYRVRLEAFEGPLDLLLFLIRKHELDVHDIPVAQITEQYMTLLEDIKSRGQGRIDIDKAGEFLLMAATLMEIKSRMIGPAKPTTPGTPDAAPSEDPRAELVRQLLEYKRFRDAAQSLEVRGIEWRQRFPAAPVTPDETTLRDAIDAAQDLEIEDLHLVDLVDAFRRISETVNFERLGEHQVTYDDTPIELHAEDILDHLRREEASATPDAPDTSAADDTSRGELALVRVFAGRTRNEMVGLFIALLELVRRRAVAFRQEAGTIYLRRRPEADQIPPMPESPPED